jgi:c-di-AMP phosphodiesterase-like protein
MKSFIMKYGLLITICFIAVSIIFLAASVANNDKAGMIIFSYLLGFASFTLLIKCLSNGQRKANRDKELPGAGIYN